MNALNCNDNPGQSVKEAEIIKRVLGGEKELFEILVRRNNQKLYRVIRSYLKEEMEIEDVMQNSYLKAFTKLYQFKLESKFSTWLVRIGINESLARLKEKGKVYHWSASHDDKNLEIPDTRLLNPQEKMIRNEAKYLLETAIDRLDTKYRTVYILKEIEGMSLKEIAEVLELTESNVKVRIHRSKTILKEKIYEISQDKNIFEFGFSRCDRVTEKVMKFIIAS